MSHSLSLVSYQLFHIDYLFLGWEEKEAQAHHTPRSDSLQLPGLSKLCSDALVCRSHACSFLIYLIFDKIGWLLEGNFQVDLSLEQSRAEHLK